MIDTGAYCKIVHDVLWRAIADVVSWEADALASARNTTDEGERRAYRSLARSHEAKHRILARVRDEIRREVEHANP